MAITAANIQDRITDGVAALDAGDYETAYTKFTAAKALMAGIPRMAFGSLQARNELQYTPESLDSLINQVRQLMQSRAGTSLFYQTPVERVRTRGTDCE